MGCRGGKVGPGVKGPLAWAGGTATIAALALLASTGAAAAQGRVIETPAELQAALSAMPGGGELLLAGGDWGGLEIRGGAWSEDRPLVIRAADPSNPPRFSAFAVLDSRGVVVEGLVFDYTFAAGDEVYIHPFWVHGSEDVVLRNLLVDGDVAFGVGPADDGFGWGEAFYIGQSTDVTLEDSELRGFRWGVLVGESDDVTIRGNDIHSQRVEGIGFSAVQDLLVEGNYVHDFARSINSDDHPDMIHGWTTATTRPSRGIAIRGNLLNSRGGWWTQSIFVRNELVDTGEAGAEMFYQDVLIEGNFILNAHLHGITVGETVGLSILNNTVVRNPLSEGADDNPPLWSPRINVAAVSRDVRIEGNVTSGIDGEQGQPDWRVGDNLFVQDRSRLEPGFYEDVFVGGDPADPASFAPKPGGPLDGVAIGARMGGSAP